MRSLLTAPILALALLGCKSEEQLGSTAASADSVCRALERDGWILYAPHDNSAYFSFGYKKRVQNVRVDVTMIATVHGKALERPANVEFFVEGKPSQAENKFLHLFYFVRFSSVFDGIEDALTRAMGTAKVKAPGDSCAASGGKDIRERREGIAALPSGQQVILVDYLQPTPGDADVSELLRISIHLPEED